MLCILSSEILVLLVIIKWNSYSRWRVFIWFFCPALSLQRLWHLILVSLIYIDLIISSMIAIMKLLRRIHFTYVYQVICIKHLMSLGLQANCMIFNIVNMYQIFWKTLFFTSVYISGKTKFISIHAPALRAILQHNENYQYFIQLYFLL